MTNFSQRIGMTNDDMGLQVDGVDERLRISIWNAVWRTLIDDPWVKPRPTLQEEFLADIWEHFFKQPADENPTEPYDLLDQLKVWVATSEWYLLYDLLEFVYTVLPPTAVQAYEVTVNRALESERSAYRIMEGVILPVSDAIEIREVTNAVDAVEGGGLGPARHHLATAVAELGKRRDADHTLTVREATAAVQSVTRWAAGREVADLTDAFATLDENRLLPTTFKQALAALFDTAGPQGAGHPFQQANTEVGLAEARFTVVTASAVINYLLSLPGASERLDPPKGAIGGANGEAKQLGSGE